MDEKQTIDPSLESREVEHRDGARTNELKILAVVLIVLLVLVGVTGWLKKSVKDGGLLPGTPGTPDPVQFEMTKFESDADAKAYWEESRQAADGMGFPSPMSNMRATQALEDMSLMAPQAGQAEPDRYSQTNVQVVGIDEPDILKTDGKTLFYSQQQEMTYWRGGVVPDLLPLPLMEDQRIAPDMYMPQPVKQTTEIVQAFPMESLAATGEIATAGELLLVDTMLVVFSNTGIVAYDVSNTASPVEKWKSEYGDNSSLVTARLKDKKLYVITQSYPQGDSICPISPMVFNGQETSIACTEIYHPTKPVPSDSTYTVWQIDPMTGNVQDQMAFVGTIGGSVIYMSNDNLYATYRLQMDTVGLMTEFFSSDGQSFLPEEYRKKLSQLNDYDISTAAKNVELTQILERYMQSLDSNARRKFENDMQNSMQDFAKKKSREVIRSGIVRINLGNLDMEATGSIPGYPLNQFAMDEYQGNLRVATTIEGWLNFGGQLESANDVYVLNPKLQEIGAIKDLGLTERIYSARFIGDRGYLVTFRQIDPFYVLDLSDARNPKKTGELKIPGYSSYLHPISEHQILGIGKEGSGVKLSVFDVENPANPQEVAKYVMAEYDSEILQTHHAFLYDQKHGAMFVPGSQGGYIFTLKDPTSGLFGNATGQKVLGLETAIEMNGVKRALFIDDYMYIVGDEGIAVVSEKNWEEVKRLKW